MTTHDKILVLADGSERTIMTADHLKEYLPGKMNKRLVLFHVTSALPEELRELEQEPGCGALMEQLKRQADEAQKGVLENLEQARRALIESGMPADSVELRIQRSRKGVAQDIIDEARKGYVGVVMRRRGIGSGSLKNIVLGSVAYKLLQSLTFIPVILVGQAPGVKKVLLAVDASANSMKAVDFVVSTLGGHDYEICVFHAVVGLGAITFDPAADAVRPLPDCEDGEDCLDAYKQKVGRLLVGVRDRLAAAGFDPAKLSVKVASGARNRAEAIVNEAEEDGYGTIVVGRRGLSRVEAFFMGRVSHGVVYEGKRFTVWVV
jgi:nucleotide-binding universal stress UspA family protein